jgi:hypothetical protein
MNDYEDRLFGGGQCRDADVIERDGHAMYWALGILASVCLVASVLVLLGWMRGGAS